MQRFPRLCPSMPSALRWLPAALTISLATPAAAFDWSIGELEGSWKTRFSVGAAWRLQKPSNDLIGKLNVPGQQDLCLEDDCLSYTGDPAPNQRLVDAAGAFTGSNQDDANLNYQQHDLVAATMLLSPDITAFYGDLTFKLRGIAHFDPVNVDYDETHNDTRYQPATVRRSGEASELLGAGADILDAFVSSYFEVGEREFSWSAGYQRIRWGESTLVALGSLSEINPPDGRRLRQPGAAISEVFRPVPVLTLATEVIPDVSAELIYQLAWEPAIADPAGSFHADNDLLNGGTYVTVGLGQFSEDPDRQHDLASIVGVISDTSTTINYLPEREARDDGQIGLRVNWYAADFNGGTEFGFYFLNYHARLPAISLNAADASCSRNGDPGDIISAFDACNGFRSNTQDGLEPLPIETMDLFLEYPEDIQMFGVSFNTNIGSWSLAGEYAYRPNMPVQVHFADIVFGALTPAFPEEDYTIDASLATNFASLLNPALLTPGNIESLANLGAFLAANPGQYTLPAARNAVPSFITAHRGHDVQGGDYIQGYERLAVGQIDFTAIKAFSSTDQPFGADQILLIAEVGATHVMDYPDRSQYQLDGGHPFRTHASPGSDGTGSNGVPDARRQNPTQQTKGFADEFAWGYRMIIQGEYNDVFSGVNIKPQIVWTHDVDGIAPLPAQNFVEGNRSWLLAMNFELSQRISTQLFWQGFTGGQFNTRKDRDSAGLWLGYNF